MMVRLTVGALQVVTILAVAVTMFSQIHLDLLGCRCSLLVMASMAMVAAVAVCVSEHRGHKRIDTHSNAHPSEEEHTSPNSDQSRFYSFWAVRVAAMVLRVVATEHLQSCVAEHIHEGKPYHDPGREGQCC